MLPQLLAYCGLDCSQCPAYIATQANDVAKLTSLAQQWFDGSTDPTIILCDGCKPIISEAHTMKWCSECPTRACAMNRQLENCAHCEDYGCEDYGCEDYGCQKLLLVFEQSKDAKANLDRIRATLQ